MDAHMLLSDFRSRGIALIPNGEKLVVEPASRLTDADREAIRAAKAELLKLLGGLHDCEDEHDRLARADGWSPPTEISRAVASEIKRVESQALALGWKSERLWNFAFWPHRGGEPRGLASVMNPGDHLTEVSADFILIEKLDSRRGRLRFWRMDG